MDTSETYIKMCDTPEIQKLWIVRCGDFFCDKSGNNAIVARSHNEPRQTAYLWTELMLLNQENSVYADGLIWLPRQDQLQEMLRDLPYTIFPWTLIQEFFKWTLEIYTHEFGETSMEQLWLAFVMKEKHGKTWDRERWNT